MPPIITGILSLLYPEETSWRAKGHQAQPFTGSGRRSRPVSLKAAFWCVVAILIALALGNLT